MPPRKPHNSSLQELARRGDERRGLVARQQRPRVERPSAPAPRPAAEAHRPDDDESQYKTRGVTAADIIRVRRVAGSGIFRDGMSVGDFLRGQPNQYRALQILAKERQRGTIGIVQATVEQELAEAHHATSIRAIIRGHQEDSPSV